MNNILVNGDSFKLIKTIPDNSFDLCITDPPYGMSYQSSRRTDKFNKISNDENIDWFPDFAKELYRVMKNDTHIYIFCNDFYISEFNKYLREAGFTVKRTLVWLKNNHTSGDLYGDYGNKTEFILFAHKGRRELMGKRDTNVLSFSRVSDLKHPTEKPVNLINYLISKSSLENDIIFDPFIGGGTTMISAIRSKRLYYGIELDEDYFKLCKSRESYELKHSVELF